MAIFNRVQTKFERDTNKKLNNLHSSYESAKQNAKKPGGGSGYLVNKPWNSGVTVGKATVKKNGGSSGSGRNGGGDGGASALMAYLAEIERRQRQAANDMYNRNVDALNNAYSQRGDLLKNNLNATLGNLQTDYNASRDSINKDATAAAKEAYINRMMSQRNLAQNMAAQGLSGGASETTMAGLENSYGEARNTIANTANQNLGNLENLYTKNRNAAQQAYNDQLAADALQKAQYMVQFENDRQNMIAQAYQNQLSQLANLDPSYLAAMSAKTSEQAAFTPEQQAAASNAVRQVNTAQGAQDATSRNYYLRLAQQLMRGGASDEDIMRVLAQENLANSSIQNILNQLG